MHNEDYSKGGDDITACLANKNVIPHIHTYSEKNFKLKKRIDDAVEKAKIALSA